MRFIKLTKAIWDKGKLKAGEPFLLNPEQITAIFPDTHLGTTVEWVGGKDNWAYVMETPDQILALIEGDAAVNAYPALAAMREALEKIERASPPDNSDVSLALFAVSLQDIASAALRLAQPAAADAG